jgi:DNA-binding SARP family transcriptional activator
VADDAGVRIRLLGGFEVTVDGRPVAADAWRLRKAKTLVKLLALAGGHRLHREALVAVLWPDRDGASATNNLHQALYVARRALAGTSDQRLRDAGERAAQVRAHRDWYLAFAAAHDPERDDRARAVWNAAHDRRPALVIRCAGAADVLRAVEFARSEGLEVAVRAVAAADIGQGADT